MELIRFLLLAIFMAFTGCRPRQIPGDRCFSQVTGLSLPPGVTSVGAKTFTVAIVWLDTHYLKFQATNDITPFLVANFHATTWQMITNHMTPPSDWLKEIPFWKQSTFEQHAHYSAVFTNQSGVRFETAISYDTNRMQFYFVGSQVRD